VDLPHLQGAKESVKSALIPVNARVQGGIKKPGPLFHVYQFLIEFGEQRIPVISIISRRPGLDYPAYPGQYPVPIYLRGGLPQKKTEDKKPQMIIPGDFVIPLFGIRGNLVLFILIERFLGKIRLAVELFQKI
jgi:hypothetical protein